MTSRISGGYPPSGLRIAGTALKKKLLFVQARRRDDDIAIVNAAFNTTIEEQKIKNIRYIGKQSRGGGEGLSSPPSWDFC